MEAAQAVLSSGVPLYRSTLAAGDKVLLAPLFLLTNKPFFCVVNLGEDEVAGTEDVLGPVVVELGGHATVLGVSVELEAEARALEPGERS